jgi:hypothetical protein
MQAVSPGAPVLAVGGLLGSGMDPVKIKKQKSTGIERIINF